MKRWNHALLLAMTALFAIPALSAAPSAGAAAQQTGMTEAQAVAKALELMGDRVKGWEIKVYHLGQADNELWENRWAVHLHENADHSVEIEFDAWNGAFRSYSDRGGDGGREAAEEVRRRVADEALHRFAPKMAGKMMLAATQSESEYTNYRYYEKVNGLPFLSNSLHVVVSGSGRLLYVGSNLRHDSSKLPPAWLASAPEQARAAYLKETSARLFAFGRIDHLLGPGFGYEMLMPDGVDALTLQPLQSNASGVKVIKTNKVQVDGGGAFLKGNGVEEVQRVLSAALDVDLAPMKRVVEEGTLEMQVISWYESEEKQAARKPAVWAWVNKEGVITNMRRFLEPDPSRTRTLDVKQGESIALEFLEARWPQPETFHVIEKQIEPVLQPPGWAKQRPPLETPPAGHEEEQERLARFKAGVASYDFLFSEQGIAIRYPSITVHLDDRTGRLLGYDFTEAPRAEAWPSAAGLLSDEQALDRYLADHPLQLAYVWESWNYQDAPYGRLVYKQMFDEASPMMYLDAGTGKGVR